MEATSSRPLLPLHGIDPMMRRCLASARAASIPATPPSFASDDAEAADAGAILERVGIDRLKADMSTRMHEVAPRLWLGSERAAASLEPLEDAGVRHIVCIMASGRPPPRFTRSGIGYTFIELEDDPAMGPALLANFPLACRVISDVHAAGGAVLVHCRAGASRSATVVTAYLMASCGARAGEALRAVQATRCIANPNTGFREALLKWEAQIYGAGSDLGGGSSSSDVE